MLWLKYRNVSAYGKCKFGVSTTHIFTVHRGPFTTEGNVESGVGPHIPCLWNVSEGGL